ncbi:hypothetical protein [Mycolicibacterium poriferae]|uniref:Uncharacterized protein n=1 Tax=Mycolicibacterium poriferae TaxID=39694 RepID=A0A6N4VJC9_9MYCO|nr:hypothetical protein [Mycolicibacterium poriferae]BBX54651.1 hypothetical protein MPOR_56770 [Mycolicibacterium poriferae]
MSAFIVDPEHIHVLLWAASRPTSPYGPLVWYYDNPSREGRLTDDAIDTVGQMLVDENAASVNYRYDEDDAYIYAYQRPRYTTWSGVEIKALHCYEYQSCEHPAGAPAKPTLLPRLERRLIGELPGYDDAPWAISSLDTPPPNDGPTPTRHVTHRPSRCPRRCGHRLCGVFRCAVAGALGATGGCPPAAGMVRSPHL